MCVEHLIWLVANARIVAWESRRGRVSRPFVMIRDRRAPPISPALLRTADENGGAMKGGFAK